MEIRSCRSHRNALRVHCLAPAGANVPAVHTFRFARTLENVRWTELACCGAARALTRCINVLVHVSDAPDPEVA